MSQYASASKSCDEGDFVGDDDDMEEDDGYDCLSDYEADMDGTSVTISGEGPSNGGDRRTDGYASRSSSHHHGGKVGMGGNGRHRADFRRYRTASERIMPDHSEDNRRDHHNHLERKRRASIKGSYCDLREAIPSLRGSKASRAVTLQRAAEYIESLTKSNREHSFCVDELSRQNDILERQVHDLYRSYQRLENDEYALTQAAVAVQSSGNVNQTSSSASFNVPAPPSTLPVTSSSPGTSSTGNSTPTTAALVPNGGGSNGSGSGNGSTGFSVPVRVVSQHQQQQSTNSNTSSPDDPPSMGFPSSGLAQLSYAALQLQQQQSNPPTSTNATKLSVTGAAVVATNPQPRLITLESSGTNTPTISTSRGIVQQQRIRLSNSLSTSGGGRPVVVVSTSSTPSSTFSALDTAVLKARAARPPLDQRQHHVVVGSNVEVVSSSAAVPIASAPSLSTGQVSGHPRRVVIVSAQHHQEYQPPSTMAAPIAPSKAPSSSPPR